MSAPTLTDALDQAAASGMTPETCLALRQAIFGDGTVSDLEAGALVDLLATVGDGTCPDWPALFADAMAEALVDQAEPEGYVSASQARWLIGAFEQLGAKGVAAQDAALVAVLRRSRLVPDALARFALNRVRDAITGTGAFAGQGRGRKAVTAADVESIRTILYACASEGFGFVTRAEAEALFAIADATAGQANDPAFDDLFARAVGNHLLASEGRHVPDIGEALRRERWLDSRNSADGLGSFFGRLLGAVISGDSFAQIGGWMDRRASDAVLNTIVERLDDSEARWVLERIERDGQVSSAEKKLLAFIQAAGPVPASLQPLLAKVA